MIKRAVLYARVSGDDRGNDGRNLSGQLDMCRQHTRKQDWQIVAELAEDDRGASGASFELPQLNRIREMAQAGEFDILVVREIDRLSRNLAKQLIVEEELKRASVQIEYVLGDYPDTPEGRLNKHIRATIAEFEREKILERLTRGRRQKVKGGSAIVHGRPPFGYKMDEVDGKTVFVINEPEAKVVRLIFVLYTVGEGDEGPLNPAAIVRRLTELAIPTPADVRGWRKQRGYAVWSKATISKMLANETYAGTWRYGKYTQDGDRKVVNPPEYLIAVDVPPIVAKEVWEAAVNKRKRNRIESTRNLKHEYLIGRRVVCGICGCRMQGEGKWSGRTSKVHYYYHCGTGCTQTSYNRVCNAPYFPVDQVDGALWDWVKSFLSNPAELVQGLEDYQEERDRETAPIRERLKIVEDLIAENQRQLRKLLDLYLAEDFPREVLTERKTRLEGTVLALAREQTSLTGSLEAQTLTDEQIKSLREFVAKVSEGLEKAEVDFKTKRWIIEMLNLEATLTVEDGQKVVYGRCLFGQTVLAIGPTNTSSRTPSGSRVPARLPGSSDRLRPP